VERAKITPMIGSRFDSRHACRLFFLWAAFWIGLHSVSAAEKIQEAVSPQSTVALFNGRDLAGWIPVGKGAAGDWSVRDGLLVCKGKGHTWLRTARQYGDFHLSLEYQLSPGANSGVYVRVGTDGNHHRETSSAPPAGFEVQILDDRAPRYAGLKDYQFSASLYDIAGASPHVTKPAGEWNALEINCAGMHVTIRHNGVRVVDATPDRYPLLKLRNRSGFLGLQSHNGVVRFRKLRIGPAE
jgi:hypothetical protein